MDIIKEFDYIDKNKIGAMGYSQGGGIALALAALNTDIRKVFAVYPFLSDYKRCWDMDTGAAYEEIKDISDREIHSIKRKIYFLII